MRISAAIQYDLKFQWRHGFYAAYALVTAVYLAALLSLSPEVRAVLIPYLVFTDTSVLGFFFIGGIILLERRQRTLDSLFVTPLRPREYLWSKTATLSALAVLVSLVVLLGGGQTKANIGWFLIGAVLGSIFFILIGIAVVARSRTLNGYFFRAIVYTIVLALPLMDYFHLVESVFFRILPTYGLIVLVSAPFRAVSFPEMGLAVINLVIWNGLAWWWAASWFNKYVIRSIGSDL
ncbi:MAG: ABC transporter permease [Candidatus Marinimicrobia bacterium]|nr:ABC transporter permease [Candidatus Neomarinimicrobiota bacterium]MCF7827802.1 ABC transporter permease [Candidatus Neomarinimicrobiota bacterium]MCF7879443.1 ABC transporter permease [Candidatus Neomarinimicrobiota bacterium]